MRTKHITISRNVIFDESTNDKIKDEGVWFSVGTDCDNTNDTDGTGSNFDDFIDAIESPSHEIAGESVILLSEDGEHDESENAERYRLRSRETL